MSDLCFLLSLCDGDGLPPRGEKGGSRQPEAALRWWGGDRVLLVTVVFLKRTGRLLVAFDHEVK